MVAVMVGGAARSIPFTSRTVNYCGLEHPVSGITKVTRKMRWQGCVLQAKPSQQLAKAYGRRGLSTCFRGGATRFKGCTCRRFWMERKLLAQGHQG